jgi:bacterioferritin-associated ferredoxin
MFVCACRAITDHQIEAAARDGARTLDEVEERLGVGRECGGCVPLIEDALQQALTEILASSAAR